MDDFKKLDLETQFGQKVDVKRESISTSDTDKSNGMLLHAGDLLNPRPDVLTYLGAMAIHVYQSPILEQLFFVSQLPVRNIPEAIAAKAITDLRGSVMEAYGRKRQVKRSGF